MSNVSPWYLAIITNEKNIEEFIWITRIFKKNILVTKSG